jgi:2-polyprenyl-6-methoxyphenol hydroxylase-like FAD-dependent oxidoreductase
LTTGLVDAAVLAKLLPGTFAPGGDKAWPALLDAYATNSRKDFVERVQKETISGKLRIHDDSPDVKRQREGFFHMLNTNPDFGMMIASKMMETLPDKLPVS